MDGNGTMRVPYDSSWTLAPRRINTGGAILPVLTFQYLSPLMLVGIAAVRR
jgi:hypothetical protein